MGFGFGCFFLPSYFQFQFSLFLSFTQHSIILIECEVKDSKVKDSEVEDHEMKDGEVKERKVK